MDRNVVPLLSPNSSSLPLVSRKIAAALNFHSSSAAALMAPPPHAFLPSPAAGWYGGAGDGSLRLRLNVRTRSLMVRNCADSGGSSVSATRHASSWPDTSPRAAAVRAASASDFSCPAWISAWQSGQLTAAGAMSAPHCGHRTYADA